MSDTTSIAAKIKAILAKAKSTDNEHEAEAFFAAAYKLMEKYQIDIEDLDRDDPMGSEFTGQRKGSVAPDWDFRLIRGCALYFGCEAIRWWSPSKNSWFMRLVGRESARVTTIEMHAYLVKTVRRLGREHWQEMPGCKNADAAARRIGTMLNERLARLAPKPKVDGVLTKAASNALVTQDSLVAYIEREFPDLRQIKSTNIIRTKSAQDIANGIGLNLQTGHSGQRRLT